MKLSIETLSHQPLKFYPDLPPDFPGHRLPGGKVLSASGDFGNLCIQEFDGENFVIRYSVIQTKEPLILDAQSHHSGVHGVIMLRNHISPIIKNANEIKIRERQFTIIQADRPQAIIHFNTKQMYSSFETLLSPSLAEALLADFPQLPASLKLPAPVHPEIWVNPPKWTDEEVMEHIGHVLNYIENNPWRRNYFENRVWDIFWQLMALYLGNNKVENAEENEKENEKAYQAQKLILDNLNKHLLIRELAREVGTSESQLKRSFKKVYGMGIHEYRTYKRLKLAIQLINEGMSVKEAAHATGWRSSELIEAYKKVYDTTPGTIKKK